MSAVNKNISIRSNRIPVTDVLQDEIDEAFYRNLCLLNIKFPMKKELKKHLKRGILKTPNSAAFHQIAYYLMSVIDATYITPDLIFVFTDPKMSVQFRKEFSTFVSDMEKKYIGYISPVMSSWLVTAGGPKVIKLLFQLTQVAILAQVSKNKDVDTSILDSQTNSDVVGEAITKHQKQLRDLIEQDYFRLNNMMAIGKIYEEEISKNEKYINMKMDVLNGFIKACKEQRPEFSSRFEELSDVTKESSLLKDWENYVVNQIETADKNWNESIAKVADQTKTSKSTSEEVIKLYRSKSCADKTLQYDKDHDSFQPDCKIDELETVTKKIVRNDRLYLPTLFEAYNIILKHYKNTFFSCDLNENVNKKLNIHHKELSNIEMKIDDINQLMSFLQQRFKANTDQELIYEGNEWIKSFNF